MKTLVTIVATVIGTLLVAFLTVMFWFTPVTPVVTMAPTVDDRIALAEHALAALHAGDRAAFEATLTEDARADAFDVCAEIVAAVDLTKLELSGLDGATLEFVAADGAGVIVPVIDVENEWRVVPAFVVR